MSGTGRASAVVVGAGIGGLATAIALDRAGIPVRVLERADELREIGASLGIQSNAVHALAGLGCRDAILDAGEPIDVCEGFGLGSGKLLMTWRQDELGRRLGAPSVMLRRSDLQKILADRIPPGSLSLSSEVSAVHGHDAAAAEVELAGGERVLGTVVVGADGIRSRIRESVVENAVVRSAGYRVWRSITPFSHPDFPPRTMRQYFGRGRTFSMWQLSGGSVSWSASAAGTAADDERLPQLRRLFRQAPPVVRELLDAADERSVITAETIDLRPLPTWVRGRVVLIGDAAHATTQVTGQGAAQAIEDALALGDCLKGLAGQEHSGEVQRRLRAFEARRRPRTARVTREARLLGRVFHLRGPAGSWVRDTAFRLRPQSSWSKQMERRLSTEAK